MTSIVARAWMAACLVAVLAALGWRAAAGAATQISELTSTSWQRRAWLLSASLDARLAEHFEDWGPLCFAIRDAVPDDAQLVLYSAVEGDPMETRKRMSLLLFWLQTLLFPQRVAVCYGTVPDPAPFVAQFQTPVYVAHMSPGHIFPMQERFDRVAELPGGALYVYRGGP